MHKIALSILVSVGCAFACEVAQAQTPPTAPTANHSVGAPPTSTPSAPPKAGTGADQKAAAGPQQKPAAGTDQNPAGTGPESKAAAGADQNKVGPVTGQKTADAKSQQQPAQGAGPSGRWSCAATGSCCLWAFGVGLLLILIVLAIVLWHIAGNISPQAISNLPTSFFFWLGMGYLVLLLLVGAFYADEHSSQAPEMLGGLLPIAVPWFGAVGAVTISLAGVFFYSDQGWDKRYNYWHIGRPLFGAVLAIVAFFIFCLIVSSAGTSIPIWVDVANPNRSWDPKQYITYYVLAFLVGYREETFRQLIQRVTDLILKPVTTTDQPAITFKQNGLTTAKLDFGAVGNGNTQTLTLSIQNTGKATLTAPNVALDGTTDPAFKIVTNPINGTPELKPGESKPIDIKLSPTQAGPVTGTLIVTGSNLTGAAKLPMVGA